VQAGADLLRDLGLHQLADEPGEALAQHVGVLIAHELAHKLVQRHARLGHRGAPLVVSLQRMRRLCQPTVAVLYPRWLLRTYTTLQDSTQPESTVCLAARDDRASESEVRPCW